MSLNLYQYVDSRVIAATDPFGWFGMTPGATIGKGMCLSGTPPAPIPDVFGPCGSGTCLRRYFLVGTDPCAGLGGGVFIQHVKTWIKCACPPPMPSIGPKPDFQYLEAIPLAAPPSTILGTVCDYFSYGGCSATDGVFKQAGEVRYCCMMDLVRFGPGNPAISWPVINQVTFTVPSCAACSSNPWAINWPALIGAPPPWWNALSRGSQSRSMVTGWGCCPTCPPAQYWSTGSCN